MFKIIKESFDEIDAAYEVINKLVSKFGNSFPIQEIRKECANYTDVESDLSSKTIYKIVIDILDGNFELKESKIIKEQNDSSANILTQAITSDKFKNNENARNVIIRANDLFYSLSEAPNNLDVLVNIENNGVVQLRMKLGSGYVQATVEDTTSNSIKTITGGEIELTEENLKKINGILETIKAF